MRLSGGTSSEVGAEIELLVNTMAETLIGRRFDLAINTISFAEMPPEVVRSYASLIDRTLADDGELFEQNTYINAIEREDHRGPGPEVILAEQLRYRRFLAHSGIGLWPARLWSGGSARTSV